jgi:hypothetical protein
MKNKFNPNNNNFTKALKNLILKTIIMELKPILDKKIFLFLKIIVTIKTLLKTIKFYIKKIDLIPKWIKKIMKSSEILFKYPKKLNKDKILNL